MKNPSLLAREFMEHGRSASCPIIDLHGHFGPWHGHYLPSVPVEKMRTTMARCGVKHIVCAHHEGLSTDPAVGNALMQEAIDRYPDDFLGYWVINPNHRDMMTQSLADFGRSRGFVGLKLGPDYHSYPLNGPDYAPALQYADERGLLCLLHTWGGSAFNPPQMVGEVAVRYPRVQFIMGHSGFGEWDVSIAIARDLPNVYLELTAVYIAHDFAMQPAGSGTPIQLPSYLSVNGIIERMVDQATSKKIVFGTDLPWYSPHFAAGTILFARIDDEARHDILHRNAERLLSGYQKLAFSHQE